MLDSLRFVASAISKKDFVPALTHYRIKDGRVTGFNGMFALSSDIDVDLEVQPHGAKFLAAIRACPEDEVISMSVTPAKRLAVKAGKFKSFVDCLAEDTGVFVEPEGEDVDLGPNFFEGIKRLKNSMGIDASRQWSMGIKLQDQFMFTTNNVMLVQYWHGTSLPFDVVIPDLAINELVRIDEPPTRIQMADKSITFWFGDNRWMRTNLLEGGTWPTDKMERLLSSSTGEQVELGAEFLENVEMLKPFLNDAQTIYLTADKMSTSQHEGDGSMVEFASPAITEMQAYRYTQLVLLAQLAKTVDWTAYPNPCMFQGDRLRGALVGQRI